MSPATEACITKQPKGLSIFEKYLTVWVLACIGAGILLGKLAPSVAKTLDGFAIWSGGAPVISVPIAVCLFFMLYPIMVKIDFAELQADRRILAECPDSGEMFSLADAVMFYIGDPVPAEAKAVLDEWEASLEERRKEPARSTAQAQGTFSNGHFLNQHRQDT